eukprot:966698-Rhodomonas_salina.2
MPRTWSSTTARTVSAHAALGNRECSVENKLIAYDPSPPQPLHAPMTRAIIDSGMTTSPMSTSVSSSSSSELTPTPRTQMVRSSTSAGSPYTTNRSVSAHSGALELWTTDVCHSSPAKLTTQYGLASLSLTFGIPQADTTWKRRILGHPQSSRFNAATSSSVGGANPFKGTALGSRVTPLVSCSSLAAGISFPTALPNTFTRIRIRHASLSLPVTTAPSSLHT